jgi:hypothetical protein
MLRSTAAMVTLRSPSRSAGSELQRGCALAKSSPRPKANRSYASPGGVSGSQTQAMPYTRGSPDQQRFPAGTRVAEGTAPAGTIGPHSSPRRHRRGRSDKPNGPPLCPNQFALPSHWRSFLRCAPFSGRGTSVTPEAVRHGAFIAAIGLPAFVGRIRFRAHGEERVAAPGCSFVRLERERLSAGYPINRRRVYAHPDEFSTVK